MHVRAHALPSARVSMYLRYYTSRMCRTALAPRHRCRLMATGARLMSSSSSTISSTSSHSDSSGVLPPPPVDVVQCTLKCD